MVSRLLRRTMSFSERRLCSDLFDVNAGHPQRVADLGLREWELALVCLCEANEL